MIDVIDAWHLEMTRKMREKDRERKVGENSNKCGRIELTSACMWK
jgi:hypothetical protein